MKTRFTLVLAVLISAISFAQQGVNYKALIKDGLGNLIVDQNIDIRFTILQGEIDAYQETHSALTDANGIAIVNIGEGTVVSGVFSALAWGNGIFSLKTEIDIEQDGSYIDMGTTPFQSVPYAKRAKIAENVFSGNYTDLSNQPRIGLERITSSNNSGWQLVGESSTKGEIGTNALDLSISGSPGSSNNGAIGSRSVAMGFSTKALGLYSSAMGNNTIALGMFSTVIGKYNVGEGGTNSYNPPISPLFEIGNGTADDNRSNALTVYGNGNAKFDGKIQHTSTGNANLIPMAYGIVESTGNILSGTGNFTAFLSGNVFVIDVNGTESLSYTNTVCLITPISTSPRTSSTVISDGNGDNDADLNVRIFNSSGTQVTTTFQFVIYKL
ncbi:hypothetical protein [Winogradskyella sp. SM1960]|uniref:hypothetical protein n=1 Tax=Winogradskyella sp. SM1960 TaxID=2865955 RepID=UPI001CD57ACC|nr:hypothetical protein [Winogradskyella sp. SM1960]